MGSRLSAWWSPGHKEQLAQIVEHVRPREDHVAMVVARALIPDVMNMIYFEWKKEIGGGREEEEAM